MRPTLSNFTKAFRSAQRRGALTLRHKSALFLLLVLATQPLLLSACSGRRVPDLARVFAEARTQTGKRPIILVPGILNVALVNSRTGETVWPKAFRSSDNDLALPITGDPLNTRDDLVPTKVIESARFLPLVPRVQILGELLAALRTHGGYREGDWDNPAPDGDRDTFYTFAYDWRRDNVQIARQLVQRIQSLKQKLDRPDLRFNIIAVSMGGLIARYAAMYGDTDLPADGSPPALTWAGAAHINNVFMFGVPNEGSTEAFATVLNGYSITEGLKKHRHLFNKLSREDAFTGLAVFQLMPHRQTARFLDRDLKPLAVDLYDPATWRLYGWSVANDPEFRKRFAQKRNQSIANHSAESVLDIHLATILKRTKLFHQALDVSSEAPAPIALLAFAGDCDETLNAPVIYFDKKRERWVTLVYPQELQASDGHMFRREEVIKAMYAPGDGRVTKASALGQDLAGPVNAGSPYRTPLPIIHAFFACGSHGEVPNSHVLQDNALTMLTQQTAR